MSHVPPRPRVLRLRDFVIVILLFAGGMAGVFWFARDSVQRDRERLLERYGADRAELLQAAALQIEAEFARLRDDLRLADRLANTADSASDRSRELHALVAVVPAYRMVQVVDRSGSAVLSVTAPELDPAAGSPELARALAEASRGAWLRPAGDLSMSGRIPGHSIWLRAAALADPGGTGSDRAVAFLVDTQSYFSKLDLLALEPDTRLLVLGPSGAPTSLTDERLAAAVTPVDGQPDACSELAELVARMRAGQRGRARLSAGCARAIGIDDAQQSVAFAPVDAGTESRWTVAMFSSTGALRSHERMIVRRAMTFGGLAGLLLLGVATYLALTIRRAALLKEKLRLESHLVRSEKLATVGVLAAGIAHEIGTPLGIARGRAEYMLSRSCSEPLHRDNLNVIVDQTDQVSRTIAQLLDFSRQRPARRRRVALSLVVGSVVELLRYEAERRQVVIDVAVADDLPPLFADSDLLQQVLVILIMNACDACETGGRIRIGAGRDAEMIRIEVQDDGCGIRPEHRHRIFDPFFTTKKRGRGTGLGLSIAARIIRDHAGRIQIESQVGQGTQVQVWWPRAAAEEAPIAR